MYSLAASQSIPLTGWEILATIIFFILSFLLWIWSLISIQLWLGNGWVTGIAAALTSFLSGLTNGWASLTVAAMGLFGAFSRSFLEGFILLILQASRIALIIRVVASALSRFNPGWEMQFTL